MCLREEWLLREDRGGTDNSRQDVARGLRRGGAAGGGAAGKGCCGGFVERFEGRGLGFVNGCGFDRFVLNGCGFDRFVLNGCGCGCEGRCEREW